MILIADGGSTKIEWSLVEGSVLIKSIFTKGINPVMLSAAEIVYRLSLEVAPHINPRADRISAIYFYGAGCLPGALSDTMRNSLRTMVGNHTEVFVHSDLLGAARALCGRSRGVACILGTGSNSCFYDGSAIVDNVPALGFILGDEGSGAVLGKRLVGDILKRRMPQIIVERFYERFNLDQAKIIQKVYREPLPNRFLGSLAPFIHDNIDDPCMHAMVCAEFDRFFTRNIDAYKAYGDYDVNFVGSIAYHFAPLLREVADQYGVSIGKIIQTPMPGLIEYHSGQTLQA